MKTNAELENQLRELTEEHFEIRRRVRKFRDSFMLYFEERINDQEKKEFKEGFDWVLGEDDKRND